MKILAFFCAVFLTACTLLSCFPLSGEEAIYDNIIRLHVIAESDSSEDQAKKLQVRDAVLACLGDALKDTADFDSARAAVQNRIPVIEDAAKATAGCAVRVTLDKETYPVRQYEGFSLPAGEYTSLRVILGEGAGKNWWCVLFPQLCTARAAEDDFFEDFIAAGFSPEQYRLIKNESGTKYKIRFKILEIPTALWEGGEDNA